MTQLAVGSVGNTPATERALPARRAAAPPPVATRAPAAPTAACVCGTVNDADALFCKKCGTRLQP
jgi:hypothetical protein